MITLREVTAADKPRITEISSQIWDGEDYVPDVLDDWLADPSGEVIVAIVDGKLISFARRSYLLPGYVWLEGARTDPAYRNSGAAQEISRYFLESARSEGADTIGLSTYIDNEASIHIIEKNGFHKVASYVYLEAGRDAPIRREGQSSSRVCEVTPEDAISFIRNSKFLRAAHGHFPNGWKFYPFERDPELVLSKMEHVLGIKEEGKLTGLLCLAGSLRRDGECTIAFIDGQSDAVEDLLRHTLHLASAAHHVAIMVPRSNEATPEALPILQQIGFTAWNEFDPDVFVYEREICKSS
ncbi:GNAT family N-acetyltransferase [Candidatus Bipolaricaulota bacterium]|nr:GNAT family N-acetyltransferase [Candidatus Bipolaricaulota bacterium]